MRLWWAELEVWWTQLLCEYATAACRATGGTESPYIDALAAAMKARDEAVQRADRLRR